MPRYIIALFNEQKIIQVNKYCIKIIEADLFVSVICDNMDFCSTSLVSDAKSWTDAIFIYILH